MIKSVVREHNWSPDIVGDLFFDSIDYKGLEFWYNDVVQVSKELSVKKK
jgi:hypothetical protein